MDEKELNRLVRTAQFIYSHITKKYAKLFLEVEPKTRPEKKDRGQSERRE